MLIVTSEGKTEQAVVGRVKIEKRPLVFIEAALKDKLFSAILQNAETVRLTAPGGSPVSVVELSAGTKVLVLVEAGRPAFRHEGGRINRRKVAQLPRARTFRACSGCGLLQI